MIDKERDRFVNFDPVKSRVDILMHETINRYKIPRQLWKIKQFFLENHGKPQSNFCTNCLQQRAYTADGENLQFSTEIAFFLGNGTRQANGCYGTLIGSRRRRICVDDPGFKVTVYLQLSRISQKQCTGSGTKLLQHTNRKPYLTYGMVPCLATLNDL